ncbi:MAG: hypothetical protein OEY56_09050, partial [Cyclobacteriaceae bacterium]|nr:hypothetical protein [Cyclobacteriaceae bacterium]
MIFSFSPIAVFPQESPDTQEFLAKKIDSLEQSIQSLAYTELIQSMSLRSILIPNYDPERKALVARQAYNIWSGISGEKYVSHFNLYTALYEANKYLKSENTNFFNQALGHSESVVSIKFGMDPNVFYSAGSDGRVLKWNLNNINGIPEIVYEGKHLIRSIDLSDDGKFLMVVAREKGIFLVTLDKLNTESSSHFSDPVPVQTAIFVPGRQQYISADTQGNLTVKGFKTDTTIIGKSKEKIISIAVHPIEDRVFTGTEKGTLDIWDEIGRVNHRFDEPTAINAMAISHNHKTLAIGREKGDIILWDLENHQVLRVISGHHSAITDVEFHPGDGLLLTTSRDRTARIWDIENTKKLPLVFDD